MNSSRRYATKLKLVAMKYISPKHHLINAGICALPWNQKREWWKQPVDGEVPLQVSRAKVVEEAL